MKFTLFLLFLVSANIQVMAAISGGCTYCVWPDNRLPVNFVMDNANMAGNQAPNNLVPNNSTSRSYLANQLKKWNADNGFFITGALVGFIELLNY